VKGGPKWKWEIKWEELPPIVKMKKVNKPKKIKMKRAPNERVKEWDSTNESEKVSGPIYVVPCRRNLKNKFK
jgi:hypothetical protein